MSSLRVSWFNAHHVVQRSFILSSCSGLWDSSLSFARTIATAATGKALQCFIPSLVRVHAHCASQISLSRQANFCHHFYHDQSKYFAQHRRKRIDILLFSLFFAARLSDVVAQALVYDEEFGPDDEQRACQDKEAFSQRLLHAASLMHGLGCQVPCMGDPGLDLLPCSCALFRCPL